MKCWPWSHDWERWQVKREGRIARGESNAEVGTWKEQERLCRKCGLLQLRTVVTRL